MYSDVTASIIRSGTATYMYTQKEQFLLMRVRVFRDEQAFGTLLKEYEPGLRRFLFSKLPHAEDAEDALSTTALRAWAYVSSTEVESFSGLLYTIARGFVAEYYRQRERRPTESLGVESEKETHDHGMQADSTENATDLSLLKVYLNTLSDEDQALIALRYFEGLSWREIGKRLDKTAKAAQAAAQRAIQKIHQKFSS